MQQKIILKLLPSDYDNDAAIKKKISLSSGRKIEEINGYQIIKKCIDARSKIIWVNLTVNAFINEPFVNRPLQNFNFKNVTYSKNKIIIIGAGPAGLFAALTLIELGIKPIILERGKEVR